MKADISLSIFGAFMVLTIVLGLLSVRGKGAGLADWSVGGRSLGSVFIWVLTAGEVYTSFSYLGAAGWGYEYGVPIYYEFVYLGCGYALGYFVGPMLWGYAKRHDLVCLSDIVERRFGARWLGALVAVAATVFLLPYIELELTGMGAVVAEISYGRLSLSAGYVIAFVVSVGFVVVSGLRGSAWVSVLKDVLVVATLIVLAVYIPAHYFGGYGSMFHRLVVTHPRWLTLPGHDSPGLGEGWFASTGVLNSLGFIVFPTTVAAYLGARSGQVLRRNAIFLPFYQLLLFVPMLLGMAALFIVPHLGNSNLALFAMVTRSLPAWLVGIVGVAGALSSIVPTAVFMLVIGTMWGTSVLGTGPRAARRQKTWSQQVTFAVGAVALILTFATPGTLVRLSVISYEGIAQFVPLLLVGLLYRRMTAAGAASGLLAGVAVVCALVFTGNDPFHGVNAGLIGLAVNLGLNLAVSLAARPGAKAEDTAEVLAVDEISAPPSGLRGAGVGGGEL